MLKNYIKKQCFHALRATCIKLALNEGWGVPEVAKLVNDKPRTIQEHYNTPTSKDLRRTAEKRPLYY